MPLDPEYDRMMDSIAKGLERSAETPGQAMKRIEGEVRGTSAAGIGEGGGHYANIGVQAGPIGGRVMTAADPETGKPVMVRGNVNAGPLSYGYQQPMFKGAQATQSVGVNTPFDADGYFGVTAAQSPAGRHYGVNVGKGALNAYGSYTPNTRDLMVGGQYQARFATGGRAVVGHDNAAGLDVSLEEHKGEMRHRAHSGDSRMAADYGYITHSPLDADHMKTDAYVGPHKDSDKVFVINQKHPHTGKFNEHKVMLGYKNRSDAVRDYVHSFNDGLGHKRVQSIVEMDKSQLRDWLKKGPHTRPVHMAEGGEYEAPPLTIHRKAAPVAAPVGDVEQPAPVAAPSPTPNYAAIMEAMQEAQKLAAPTPNVTARNIAAQLQPPEEQGAASPTVEGVIEGAQSVGRGAVKVPSTIAQYIKETSEKPDPSARLGEDIGEFAKSMYHGAVEDPAGFVGGALPFVGNMLAGADISKVKDMAAQARAEGDEALASKLDQIAATSAASIILPAGAGVASKAGVKAAEKEAVKAATKALTAKADVAHSLFEGVTGRPHGTAPTDIPLLGRGDITFPPGVTPETFADEVARKAQDIRDWNNPQRRYWYENSGQDIHTAVGGDPEMADRLTLSVAKTSQGTPVLDNASYSARAHHQIMAGDPVSTGKYPAAMSPAIQEAYTTPEIGAVGPKISGYQSGFRSAWMPQMLNAGANDIHNMRWHGWNDFNGTPTTGQHNYDRMVRSAVTDILNKEGFDGGAWQPGQVQAVGWAKSRAAGGVPEAEAGYDLTNAFADRTGRLTYETAPGLTTNHLPEYHDAPIETKHAFHDAMNSVLMDEMGRDRIASHMGLLTLPTEHGTGVYMNNVSPGSAARVVTGGAPGGWENGIDASTKELMKAAELTRGLLLRQDASAYHFPAFPSEKGMTWKDRDIFDVRTGQPMTLEEGKLVNQKIAEQTGGDFFSPIFTPNGYRFINVPEYSGISNKAFKEHLDAVLKDVYADHPGEITVGMGKNDGFYQSNDWKQNGAEDYLQGLRTLRPDVQRRAAELLATLGPSISKVEDGFAKTHGWTPDKSTRVWETNPAYAKHADKFKGIVPGSPPKPHSPDFGKQFFDPDLIGKARGGKVNFAKGGSVGDIENALVDFRMTAAKHGAHRPKIAYLIRQMGSGKVAHPEAALYAHNLLHEHAGKLASRLHGNPRSLPTIKKLTEDVQKF